MDSEDFISLLSLIVASKALRSLLRINHFTKNRKRFDWQFFQ